MPISSDEKKRIQEEEKVRAEAREKLRQEAEAKKRQQGCLGCMGLLAILLIVWLIRGIGAPEKKPSDDAAMLPEIRAFFAQYPEFGKIMAVTNQPDWANGKRQTVTTWTSQGLQDYLFYTKQGQVQTVYAITQDQGRIIVWGETESNPANAQDKPIARPATGDLPAYTVLFSVDLADGSGRMGQILVPSLSRKTPASKRESVARGVAAKEGFVAVYLYRTEDAYKADMSSSYAKAHPDALKNGYLGMLEQGKFNPPID